MAMIKCKECGGAVSDTAPSCPHCGTSAPGGSSTLRVKRTMAGMMIGVELFVDGKPYGALKPRGEMTLPLPPGEHHVEARTSKGKSRTTTVTVTPRGASMTMTLSAMSMTPKFQ